jgi:hypothetical protein
VKNNAGAAKPRPGGGRFPKQPSIHFKGCVLTGELQRDADHVGHQVERMCLAVIINLLDKAL